MKQSWILGVGVAGDSAGCLFGGSFRTGDTCAGAPHGSEWHQESKDKAWDLENEIKIPWEGRDCAHGDSSWQFLLRAQGSLVGLGRGGERVLLGVETWAEIPSKPLQLCGWELYNQLLLFLTGLWWAGESGWFWYCYRGRVKAWNASQVTRGPEQQMRFREGLLDELEKGVFVFRKEIECCSLRWAKQRLRCTVR